jgi:hypothetical protein
MTIAENLLAEFETKPARLANFWSACRPTS